MSGSTAIALDRVNPNAGVNVIRGQQKLSTVHTPHPVDQGAGVLTTAAHASNQRRIAVFRRVDPTSQPSAATSMTQDGLISYYRIDSSCGVEHVVAVARAMEIANSDTSGTGDAIRLAPIQFVNTRTDESLADDGNVDITTTGLDQYIRYYAFMPLEEARINGGNMQVNTAWAGEQTGNATQLTGPPAYDENGTVSNPGYTALPAGASVLLYANEENLAICNLQPFITQKTKPYGLRYYSRALPLSNCAVVGRVGQTVAMLQQHLIVQGFNYAPGVSAYLQELYSGKTTAANMTVIEKDELPLGAPAGGVVTNSHVLRGLSGKYAALLAYVRNDEITYAAGDISNLYSSTWNYTSVSAADTRAWRPIVATNFTNGGGVAVDINPVERGLLNARFHTRMGQGAKAVLNGPFCDLKSLYVYCTGANPRANINWGHRDGSIYMDERHKLSYILRDSETARASTSHVLGFRCATVSMEGDCMKVVRL